MKSNGHEEPATERIRQRMAAWVAHYGHGGQRELLRRIKDWCGQHRSDQWLSDILNRRANLTTDDIDLIAMAMETRPGELVRWTASNYLEVSRAETTLVRWFRALTSDARRFVLGFIAETFKEIDDLEKMTVAKTDSTSTQLAGHDSQPAGGSPSHVARGVSGRRTVDVLGPEVPDALRAEVERLREHAESLIRLIESGTHPAATPPARRASKSAPRSGAGGGTPDSGAAGVRKRGA